MNERELGIKELLECMYKRKKILVYMILIALIIAMLYSFMINKPIYETTAQVLIDKADASIVEFVASKDVMQQSEITASFDKVTKLVKVSTKTNIPEKSLSITNQYLQNLQARLTEVYKIQTFELIQTPKMAVEPCNVNYIRDIMIALFLAILLYHFYILVIVNIRGITNFTELEKETGLRLLGNIRNEISRADKKTNNFETQRMHHTQNFKRIEINIELNKDLKRPRTILITATNYGVGNTYVVNNLAMQYAKLGKKVLLIDSDFKRSKLSSIYLAKESKGLTNFLSSKKITIEEVLKKTEIGNISIMPIGTEKVEEDVLILENTNGVLIQAKEKFDVILIDALPITKEVSPIAWSSMVEANVLVAEYEKTQLEDILKAKTMIENVGGKISGIVINKT